VDEKAGFSVDPKRWIIERTFSWLGGRHRLNRDYERHTDPSETMVRAALLSIALDRLASKRKQVLSLSMAAMRILKMTCLFDEPAQK
jgi:transposase